MQRCTSNVQDTGATLRSAGQKDNTFFMLDLKFISAYMSTRQVHNTSYNLVQSSAMWQHNQTF